MTLSSLAFIYLSFYYVALIIAFFRARAGTAPKARNSLAAMIIGAVGSLLIFVSAKLSPGGTVPLVFVAIMALVPVFIWGLGNLVGFLVATWRPYLPAQLALGVLAIGVPLILAILAGVTPTLFRSSQSFSSPAVHAQDMSVAPKTTGPNG